MVLNHINQPGKSGHFDVGYKVLIIHRMHYILFKSTQLERKIATNTHPVDHNLRYTHRLPHAGGTASKTSWKSYPH